MKFICLLLSCLLLAGCQGNKKISEWEKRYAALEKSVFGNPDPAGRDYKPLIALLDTLYSIDPRNTDYLHSKAFLQMLDDDSRGAIASYRKILSLEKGAPSAETFMDLGLAYDRSGERDSAVFYYQKASEGFESLDQERRKETGNRINEAFIRYLLTGDLNEAHRCLFSGIDTLNADPQYLKELRTQADFPRMDSAFFPNGRATRP